MTLPKGMGARLGARAGRFVNPLLRRGRKLKGNAGIHLRRVDDMAPLGVALSAFALLAGAAASSTAAQPPAVAEATTDGAPNPSTLLADAALVDPKPADTTSADPRTLADATAATSGAASSYASTADRRALRGCNPKKNTSCLV